MITQEQLQADYERIKTIVGIMHDSGDEVEECQKDYLLESLQPDFESITDLVRDLIEFIDADVFFALCRIHSLQSSGFSDELPCAWDYYNKLVKAQSDLLHIARYYKIWGKK